MARRLRFPLLFLLGVLVAIWAGMPRPAYAETPNCTNKSVGHYSSVQGISGSPSLTCGGGPTCTIGYISFEWDCVQDGGTLHPANVTNSGPTLCTCTTYSVRCC